MDTAKRNELRDGIPFRKTLLCATIGAIILLHFSIKDDTSVQAQLLSYMEQQSHELRKLRASTEDLKRQLASGNTLVSNECNQRLPVKKASHVSEVSGNVDDFDTEKPVKIGTGNTGGTSNTGEPIDTGKPIDNGKPIEPGDPEDTGEPGDPEDTGEPNNTGEPTTNVIFNFS